MRDWLFLALGIIMLYGGGEILVRSAVNLALQLRLSPIFIGLTVVAFGTSAPELAATLVASFKGAGAVAFGNVVGSNIANLGLVLGLVTLLRPVKTTSQFVTQETPFMIFTGLLLFFFAHDGALGRLEGLIFLVFLLVFLFLLWRRDSEVELLEDPPPRTIQKVFLYLLGTCLGIALLSWGADVLIEGAIGLARRLGISERVIGLTLVAVGTSLPELVSTLIAAYRQAHEIILGNLIGSNIMNVLAILGVTSLVHPFGFERQGVFLDLSVMMFFFLLTWMMLSHKRRLTRSKGAILCVCYAFYIFLLYYRKF